MKALFAVAIALATPLAMAQQLPADLDGATLASVNGEVLLAQHAQVGPAEEGMLLKAGDRLMTMDHSAALVAFADGCQQRVEPNSLLTIGETSACRQGRMQPVSFSQAIGETGGRGAPPKKEGLTPLQKTGIAAAVIIPLLLWQHERHEDDDRKPVSR
jgi:hypothetical protein